MSQRKKQDYTQAEKEKALIDAGFMWCWSTTVKPFCWNVSRTVGEGTTIFMGSFPTRAVMVRTLFEQFIR
jgi:hypothetical protein